MSRQILSTFRLLALVAVPVFTPACEEEDATDADTNTSGSNTDTTNSSTDTAGALVCPSPQSGAACFQMFCGACDAAGGTGISILESFPPMYSCDGATTPVHAADFCPMAGCADTQVTVLTTLDELPPAGPSMRVILDLTASKPASPITWHASPDANFVIDAPTTGSAMLGSVTLLDAGSHHARAFQETADQITVWGKANAETCSNTVELPVEATIYSDDGAVREVLTGNLVHVDSSPMATMATFDAEVPLASLGLASRVRAVGAGAALSPNATIKVSYTAAGASGEVSVFGTVNAGGAVSSVNLPIVSWAVPM